MITINIAQQKDLDPLVELFEEYRKFYKKEPAKQKAKKFLKERLEQNESVIIVSKNNQNKLTGFLQLYPLFSSTQMEKLWLLNDLYVKPDNRQQGISVALINEAKQHCKKTNACGLLLETAKTNIIGNTLYIKTQFVLDTEHNYYFWESA